MIRKIAGILVGFTLGALFVFHLSQGEYAEATIDILVAGICWRLWFGPRRDF